MALKEKEKLFADLYIKYGNAYQAALEAGYAKTTAKDSSKWINREILKKPNERKKFKAELRDYIDARMAEKEKELIADQNEILEYLTAVMRGTETDEQYVVGTDGAMITVPVRKQVNQLKAAEMLAKRYGLLVDKMEMDADVEMTINVRRV